MRYSNRYRRSGTAMDAVSQFTPQSLARVRSLGRLGQFDPWGAGEYGETPVYEIMTGAGPAAVPETAGDWSFADIFKQAPAILRDLWTARTAAEYQDKLLEIQLERARRGQSPLDMQRYGPQVNVGVAPQTQRAAAIGIGTLALVGIGIGAALLFSRR